MELYLDSVDFNEIEKAFELGFLTGLTTTPTFMHRHGITDIDGAIVKLSKMVPILQVEALGETAEEIIDEAARIKELPTEADLVFKIPISMEGVKACKKLVDQGDMVNIHLIYTLNQAYMAMEAGAHYVCPLVGRLHDQGHDAMGLIEDAVNAVNRYNYDTKIMVSSVRHPEHVRMGLKLGAQAVTAPYKIMEMLTQNAFTTIGVEQFFEHTRLTTLRVRDVMRTGDCAVTADQTVSEALVKMTEDGFGAVMVMAGGKLIGTYTDGDIRRAIQSNGKLGLERKMSEFTYREPISVSAEAVLLDAVKVFKEYSVDTLIVMENNQPIGFLDIQELVNRGIPTN